MDFSFEITIYTYIRPNIFIFKKKPLKTWPSLGRNEALLFEIWCTKSDKIASFRHIISYNVNFQLQQALFGLKSTQHIKIGPWCIFNNNF